MYLSNISVYVSIYVYTKFFINVYMFWNEFCKVFLSKANYTSVLHHICIFPCKTYKNSFNKVLRVYEWIILS